MKKLFLLSFLLSFSIPAFAEGVVSVGCGYFAVQLKSGASAPIVPTAEEACTNLKPGTYPYYSPTLDQSCGHVVGYCITDINHMNGDLVHFWFPYCPPNASGAATTFCTCDDGFVPDPAKTSCVPVDTCPQVKALTALPDDDACAQALENLKSTQAQKDAACGTLSKEMQDGKSCLETKLSKTNDLDSGEPIPMKVTADMRNLAYQKHLRDIWDKMERLVRETKSNPAMRTACATRRAEIAAEKGCNNAGACKSCYDESATQRSHCLKGRPSSSNDAPHTKGNALDVSEDSTIDPLQAVLDGRNPPQTIQQFLDGSPDCKLKWGGTFTDNYDPIHFQVK